MTPAITPDLIVRVRLLRKPRAGGSRRKSYADVAALVGLDPVTVRRICWGLIGGSIDFGIEELGPADSDRLSGSRRCAGCGAKIVTRSCYECFIRSVGPADGLPAAVADDPVRPAVSEDGVCG